MRETSLHFPPWLERCFCGLLLVLKTVHFWRSRGILIGYDTGDHLLRYAQTDWWMPEPGLHQSFYAYHPPLGFLLPHALARLGMDGVVAMQLFSTFSGTVAFLFLRGTLKRLGLLENAIAVGFLYLWSAMPILVNCDVSLNLDLVILAWGCGILYVSIRLWATADQPSRWCRIGWSIALVLMLAGAMMTKFSGLLLFALPVLVVVAFCSQRASTLVGALILALLAGLLVFPYYQQRYLKSEKTFFPRNQDWCMPADIEKAAAVRDNNRTAYFAQLFTPRFLQPPRAIETRATDVQRYSDVWRDFWIRDDLLYYQSDGPLPHGAPAIKFGVFYQHLFTISCLAGLLVWLRSRNRGSFDRLGFVLLAESALFVAAHLIYCYRDATALFGVTKAIYILPATAGVAFLAVQWLRTFPGWSRRWQQVGAVAGPMLLAAWMAINFLLPVY